MIFLPLFLELQMMYNAAVIGSKGNRYFVNDIQVRNYFEHNKVNNAGRVAHKKIYKKRIRYVSTTEWPESIYMCKQKKSDR